jgi:hypothetical protein
MEFVSLIGEGEDYVAGVWDEWLEDRAGFLASAVLGGRVVGLSHLIDLGHGEWWLEGLRVDPRLHGQHIGSHLHEYQVDQWLATDGTVVRLVTHRERSAVHRMCAKTGFAKTATVSEFSFEAAGGGHRFQPAVLEEAERAVPRLLASSIQTALGGLMDLGWRFARIEDDRIAAAAREGRLWTWGKGEGLLAARFEEGSEGRTLAVSAIAPPERDASAFLQDIPRLAGSLGVRSGQWLAPDARPGDLVRAGYHPVSTDPLWIFERRR